MDDRKRKMVLTPTASKEIDVDALIAAAPGPPPKKKKVKAASRPRTPAAAPAPKREVITAPWDEPATEPRRPINFLLSQRHRQMLHFLKAETGLPTQKRLEKLVLDAIEEQAISLWEDKHGK